MQSNIFFKDISCYWPFEGGVSIIFVIYVSRLSLYCLLSQAFRFMVGPGHCPMISKYGPSLSKAVGPVDPSFLVVNKPHFNKKKYSSYSESTKTTKQKVYVGSQYSKTCLKQPPKRQNKDLNNKW